MANEFRIKNGLIVESLVYPNVDGTVNQVIKTDGSNNLTFSDVSAADVTGLANVATSGDYNDLLNLPTLVENFNDLADVNLVAPGTGSIVKFNGSQWVVGPDLGLVEQIDSANTLLTVTDPNGPIATLTINEANINIANTTGTLPSARVSGLVEEFTDLNDTPSDYVGDALKYVRVNTGATALEFNSLATVAETGDYNDLANLPTLSVVSTTGDFNDLLNIPASVNVDTFLELLDVPNSYAGQAGMVLVVNPAENGITFDDVNDHISLSINDLTDVDTTTVAPTRGDVLQFDGTNWIPGRTFEWVRIDYTIAGEFGSETHSPGISLVDVLTTGSSNITIDVTFTGAMSHPPISIKEYGYIFSANDYIIRNLTTTIDYFIRPSGGTAPTPSPNPFGAFGDGTQVGTFKVDKNESGAVNNPVPPFDATHMYLVFGF